MNLLPTAPTGMVVEAMKVADVPEVMEIERASFPSPWSTGMFLHELKLGFSRSRILRRASTPPRIAGYVIWWVIGEEVQLLNVAVRDEDRGHGAGRFLVQLVVDDALANRATEITLEVRRTNEAAIAMYRSFGFAEVGVRKNYYGRGDDALLMTKPL